MIIQTISMKSITAEGLGTLSVFEGGHDVPFDIKRIYYIYGAPQGTHRGGHAHKALRLDDPAKGLIVEHNMWREMIWQQENSVLCVAADSYYEAEDYIRDYDEFLKTVQAKG